MKLCTFIMICFISSTVADLSCENSCEDRNLTHKMISVRFMPNKDELRAYCPKALTYLECQKNCLEKEGHSLEELTTSSDNDYAFKSKTILAATDLAREMCNEDSSFHKDYIASLRCFREFYIYGPIRSCQKYNMKRVEEFFAQLYVDIDEEDISSDMIMEMACLKDIYTMVCIIDKLGDRCGSVAQRTAKNVLERFKGLWGSSACRLSKNLPELKLKLLDYLELDEQERAMTQEIFDLS